MSGHITTEQRDVNMYFYDDQPSQWPAVWGSDLTCQGRFRRVSQRAQRCELTSLALATVQRKSARTTMP